MTEVVSLRFSEPDRLPNLRAYPSHIKEKVIPPSQSLACDNFVIQRADQKIPVNVRTPHFAISSVLTAFTPSNSAPLFHAVSPFIARTPVIIMTHAPTLSWDVTKRFADLPQNGMFQAEYVWIGGNGLDLRCKTKTMMKEPKELKDFPIWNFDGTLCCIGCGLVAFSHRLTVDVSRARSGSGSGSGSGCFFVTK